MGNWPATGEAEAGAVHRDHRWHSGHGQRPAEETAHTSKREFERLRDEHGTRHSATFLDKRLAELLKGVARGGDALTCWRAVSGSAASFELTGRNLVGSWF